MINVTFSCEPTEYAWHLMALVRGLGDAPEIERVLAEEAEDPATGGFPIGTSVDAPTTQAMAAAAANLAHPPAPAPEVAKTVAPEENPGRRRRRAAEPAPAPAISSGEERVDPQDTADEAAEAATAKEASGGLLTLNDVRRLVKVYTDTYGHEAGVHDIRGIVGGPISEIPDTQEAISAAMTKLSAAIAAGRPKPSAPQPETKREPQPETKIEPQPETKSEPPAAEEGLFGDAPAAQPEPEPRGTEDSFREACLQYAKKHDPQASLEPLKSTIMQDDVKIILGQVFNLPGPAHWPHVKANVPGDNAVKLGKIIAAVRQATLNNPFKR